jgi:hypothetical protein
MEMQRRTLVTAAAVMLVAMSHAGGAAAQSGETFTATASVTSPAVNKSAPILIRIERYLTDAERTKVVDVAKKNDVAATRKMLASMPDLGFIEVGGKRTPVKYAYTRPVAGGRLVTAVTADAILHLGSSMPDAKPKAGFDLALALLVLDAKDTGEGEFAPAAKIKANDQGAVVVDDYGSDLVRLTGISKSK